MRSEPLRMLIVEDDEDYQVVLRKEVGRLRAHANIETCFLDNVTDARKIVERARVDVILTDFDLRDGNGAELTRHAQAAAPASHRIMLTGAPERAREAAQGTSHAVWDKAIGLRELRSRLLQLVTSRVPHAAV